jgi:hypothetical protein
MTNLGSTISLSVRLEIEFITPQASSHDRYVTNIDLHNCESCIYSDSAIPLLFRNNNNNNNNAPPREKINNAKKSN